VDSIGKVHLVWWIVASVLNEDYDCPACENFYIDQWAVVYNYRIPAEHSNDNESTDNGNPSDNHNSNTTPGFEVYLLFCGILLFILFKMKK
jgi:choline dehydrogenase-like flavoprotein